MSDRGIKCPNCGGEEITGSVTAYYMKVPLARDGYCPTDGKVTGYDITEARCQGCDAQLSIIDLDEGKVEAALSIYGVTLSYQIDLRVAAKSREEAVRLSQEHPTIKSLEDEMTLAHHQAQRLGEWWQQEGVIEICPVDP